MNKEIMQLEDILNGELDACLKLEKYINEKNDCLVRNDMEKIKEVDDELSKYNCIVEKLEEKRKQIYPENVSLVEIIKRIENKEQANKLSGLREKIKGVLNNLGKINAVSEEILKFSLKLAESSAIMIANILVPEGAAYNRKGMTKNRQEILNISSVEHEA